MLQITDENIGEISAEIVEGVSALIRAHATVAIAREPAAAMQLLGLVRKRIDAACWLIEGGESS